MSKEERKKKALAHKELMDKIYYRDTFYSVEHSKEYYDLCMISDKSCTERTYPRIFIMDSTTSEAIDNFYDRQPCVLNFASYKYPGGGFINGAIAQEEALCHDSNLYNILSDKKFENNYNYNRNNLNNGLYSDWAIYTPDVIFTSGKYCDAEANVITCAAPNLGVYGKDDETYREALSNRIKCVLEVAEENNQKLLILGAFGCGVFKNDPYLVANTFKSALENGGYHFDMVIFAIPGGQNLEAFKKVFELDICVM